MLWQPMDENTALPPAQGILDCLLRREDVLHALEKRFPSLQIWTKLEKINPRKGIRDQATGKILADMAQCGIDDALVIINAISARVPLYLVDDILVEERAPAGARCWTLNCGNKRKASNTLRLVGDNIGSPPLYSCQDSFCLRNAVRRLSR